MSAVIYKFPLQVTDFQTIYVPQCVSFHPLCVQEQNGQVCLWAKVVLGEQEDPESHKQRIFICGTGHPLGEAERAQYVGTVQTMGGRLVWHVFWEPV